MKQFRARFSAHMIVFMLKTEMAFYPSRNTKKVMVETQKAVRQINWHQRAAARF